MGPGMRQVVVFGDRYMGGGNFGVECGVPHCNQWGVCGLAVQKCVNCQSCGLGLCVGLDEALVAMRFVPKLLWGSLVTHTMPILHGYCL